MRKQKFWRKLCALALALCVCVVTPGSAMGATIQEMEQRQEELEKENDELEEKLAQLRDDEAQKEAYQQTLQDKINLLQTQIDEARQNIDTLNASITSLTMKLEESQKKVQDTIDQFKERLVALYKAGDISTLEILLNSSSLNDFIMRSEMVEAMTLHDQTLMDKIEEYMDSTQAEREECEDSKKKVAEIKKDLENDQEELDALYQENAQAIADLKTAQSNTQKLIDDNEDELAENDRQMQELIEEQKRLEEEQKKQQEETSNAISYPVGGGGVEGFNPIWPLPGVSYVSAGYGGYAGHRGMDIAGPYGTPVVAAESGVVIRANSTDSWGDSWGYYVLIYHNETFTTRYAHLSSLTVYDGQYVEQGTVVGYEGATGNVTGPHLHFEVYQNGSRVDPMLFL